MPIQSAQLGELKLLTMEHEYSTILESLLVCCIDDVREAVEDTKTGGSEEVENLCYYREVERILRGTVNRMLSAESKYRHQK